MATAAIISEDGLIRGAAADPLSILKTLDLVVYDWDIESDRLSWGPNAATTLAGFPEAALATGAGYAALISSESETSRFQAIHESLGADDGAGAPFRAVYRIASAEAGRLEIEDFGRWYAGPGARPARAHGVVRVVSREAASDAPPAFGPASDGAFCNRRQFNAWVDARCAEARPTDDPFGILMLGVTNLAAINRREGYDAADEMILAVGRRIARSLRAGDRIVRYSGGRFALFVGLTAAEQLEDATQRIVRLGDGAKFESSAGVLRAEARAGAVLAPRHGRTAHLLLQRAEEAFETAQEASRRFSLYAPDEALGEVRRREQRAADEIVSALNEGRLVLAFQPIVRAAGSGPGFEEALARIRLEDGTLLFPEAIIPIAERTGLIELIDTRVLELTLGCLERSPERRLSMNVSAASLRSAGFLSLISHRLIGRPDIAERLIVEIIETQAILDVEETAGALARLKKLGLRIAMDDFGAGHTSFRNLRRLGVDMVKIDGAFVQNLARSIDDRFFVRTLASLARHLGIETVAEWVQDAEAIALLTEWGVNYLQGHAIGAAEVPEEVSLEPPRRATA